MESNFLTQLIRSVRELKLLYHKRHPLYYNKLMKEQAWVEIAAKTDSTADECKNKWKQLRERFGRELKKREYSNGKGTGEENDWELFQELLFLTDSITPRRRTRELRNAAECAEPLISYSALMEGFKEEPSETSSVPPAKMRRTTFDSLAEKIGGVIVKLEEMAETSPTPPSNDSDEVFFRAAFSMMKSLPRDTKDDIKDSIMLIILEKKRNYLSNKL